MTDELSTGDPLHAAVLDWQRPVPVAPGLPQRTARRRQRKRRSVAIRIATVALLLVGVSVVVHRQAAGISVTFALPAPGSHSVALVGDFTDWRTDRVELTRKPDGLWEATVKLRPGRYRFSYLVDHAEWRADVHAASVADDFGRPTSILTVVHN